LRAEPAWRCASSVRRGTSSKRGDGGRSLVPMTPEGTSRESEEASATPAVKLGSAAHHLPSCQNCYSHADCSRIREEGHFVTRSTSPWPSPLQRSLAYGIDPLTESELPILLSPDEMVCSFPRAISNDRHATTSTRSDCCPALGDVSLLRIGMYSRPRSEIPLGEMLRWVRQTCRRRA
jgi:hypothetical protein